MEMVGRQIYTCEINQYFNKVALLLFLKKIFFCLTGAVEEDILLDWKGASGNFLEV